MVSNMDRVQRAANRRRIPAPGYLPGQKVWLCAQDLHLPTFARKLAPRFVGPYVIEKVLNPSTLRLQLPSSLKVHPVFHVSQVKPVASSPLSPPAPTLPPPRVLKGGDLVWEVSRILAVRRRGRGFQYLVDWVGYGPEDRSWIPLSYLADPGLLERFYKEHPQAVGWSPGVSRGEGGTVVNQQAATPSSPTSSTEARADAELPISTNADQLNSSTRCLHNFRVIVNSTGGKSCTRELIIMRFREQKLIRTELLACFSIFCLCLFFAVILPAAPVHQLLSGSLTQSSRNPTAAPPGFPRRLQANFHGPRSLPRFHSRPAPGPKLPRSPRHRKSGYLHGSRPHGKIYPRCPEPPGC